MKKVFSFVLSLSSVFFLLSCNFGNNENNKISDYLDVSNHNYSQESPYTNISMAEEDLNNYSSSLASQEPTSSNQDYCGCDVHSSSSNNSEQSYKTETILEYYYGNNGSLTQWDQSMAVYGDKAFLFLDTTAETINNAGYSFVVIDLVTKEIVFKGNTPTRDCHNNNAQFLDTFYSSNDQYPLLLLSRGDYPSSEEAGKCYIVRVTEQSNEFKLTIIKTISCTLEQAKYNGSWVTDRCGNLFLYTMTIGDWKTPETDGNKFVLYRFNMFNPLNTTDIVLSENDVISSSTFDYCILQGADGFNGKLYMPIGHYTKLNGIPTSSDPNIIAVVNPINGLIEETIPSDAMENEGASIFNGKLYVSSKNVTGTSETMSPTFKIQSIELGL